MKFRQRGMDSGVDETLLISSEVGDGKGRVYEESKKIWRIALPGMIGRLASSGTLVVTQSFIGHIGSVDLAAYALVQSLTYRFMNGVLVGMSSAAETLCGQAYGAKQNHMMGVYLQRSWIVDLAAATILLPLFIFGASFFKLVGEDTAIAEAAGYISWWFIPFVYGYVFTWTNQMYLQAQQKNSIVAYISILQIGLHVVLSRLFVYYLNWGVDGAMAAQVVSCWFVVFAEFGYIMGGWCPQTWTGFTTAAFKDLFPVVKLSISSGVMICLELWYSSIFVLLASYMPNAEVAISAFSVCLNINTVDYMICLGFLSAACIRVANELGFGDVKAIKFSIKVLVSTTVMIGVVCTILCLALGHSIGYLFSNDVSVVNAVSELSYLLAISVLLNSIYPVLSGVFVGAGLQGKVAVINLCSYYVIGIPVGALLGYVAHLQVKGLWIGMNIGILVQTLSLAYMAWKTDWDLQVQLADQRLQRWAVKSPHHN